MTEVPADDALGPDQRDPERVESELGDFTVNRGVLRVVVMAAVVGLLSATVALVLLQLIALVTNLAYFQEWSSDLRTPAGNDLGLLAVLIPALGGLMVGLMARYGSEWVCQLDLAPPRWLEVAPPNGA